MECFIPGGQGFIQASESQSGHFVGTTGREPLSPLWSSWAGGELLLLVARLAAAGDTLTEPEANTEEKVMWRSETDPWCLSQGTWGIQSRHFHVYSWSFHLGSR